VTVIPRRTVSEVLATLDAEFGSFVTGFCGARYVLWIGSGVSRGVVPGVSELLMKVIEFVRSKIDSADPTCPYGKALNEILDIGSVPATIRGALDLTAPTDTWPGLADIVGRLVDHYASVLNVQVGTHDPDYLVWEAVDPAGTYGDPTLMPDSEHLCIAILIMEGVVRSAPTTNWDGLVEAAMSRLTSDAADHLRVVVLPDDLRDPDARPELVKFHGCAVLAAEDESTYRPQLIARALQISTWTSRHENHLMMNRLSDLFTTRDALFVGLSVQDANIQSFFSQGIENLSRSWPHTPPAIVFAEETLRHNHELVLQVAYGDEFSANKPDIEASALLGAYAKPVLIALVLVVFAEKLCVWIDAALGELMPQDELERVRGDLRSLRDGVGALADADDSRAFVETTAALVSFALTVFRTGNKPDPVRVDYQPVSPFPATDTHLQPDFPASAFGRFGVALSLLGRGSTEGRWALLPGSPASPSGGVVRVTSGRGVSRIFVVSDSRALSQLEVGGVIDLRDADLVVVLAEAPQVPATRSPRSVFGRTGVTSARQVDLEGVCSTVNTADELFEAFTLGAAI
jgi:hypothetical protein